MIHAGQHAAEQFAVVDHASDRNAAEADAVIAALAADQARTLRVAARGMIGERDLERGIDRFRSGIAKEDVIEARWRERRDAACKFEGLRMSELERWGVVQRRSLLGDCLVDRRAAMSGVRAPHASGTVDDAAPVGREIMHVLGASQHARCALESAIGGERHPVRRQIVRRCELPEGLLNVQGERPLCGCGGKRVHPIT